MSNKHKAIRVKLIINPGAGNVSEAGKNLQLVKGYLEKNGLKVNLAYAKPKEEATSIAKRAVKDKYKLVIVMGGDGTVEAVMRGLIGSKVHLGIIPAGTENNIARSLGVPIDLQEACALIGLGHTEKLDMGQVKTSKGKKYDFFELATIGLSAAIYPDASKVSSGKIFSIKAALSTLIKQEVRPNIYLTLDDESKIEVDTMLVMVSNTPVFGKNFRVAPGASLQDGLLDVAVYPNFSKTELLGYYAAVMDGGYSGDGKVQHYRARKIKVKSSPKLDVMADGIELGKGTVTIKVLPAALRVITPKLNPASKNSQTDSSRPTTTESVIPDPIQKPQLDHAIAVG